MIKILNWLKKIIWYTRDLDERIQCQLDEMAQLRTSKDYVKKQALCEIRKANTMLSNGRGKRLIKQIRGAH